MRSSQLSSSSIPLSSGSGLFDNGSNRKRYSDVKENNFIYDNSMSYKSLDKTKILNKNETENSMDIINSFSPNRRKRENENVIEDDRNDRRTSTFLGPKYLIIDDDNYNHDNSNNNNDRNTFISNNFIIENNIMGTQKHKKNQRDDRKIENFNKKMRFFDGDVTAISSFNGLSLEKESNINIP